MIYYLDKDADQYESVAFYKTFHRLINEELETVVEHWYDDKGILCIRYDNGQWFHYKGYVYSLANGIIDQTDIQYW